MLGLGTIVNCLSIIIGGILGLFVGKFINEKIQETLIKVCGLSTMFIAIAGVMSKMLGINEDGISSSHELLLIISLAIGAIIGEIIDLDGKTEKFGIYLRNKTGNERDNLFVSGFVSASLTVCIGAMAIIGAINDGISSDYSILFVKSILDFIIVMVMACSLGKGCIFSFIPVFILQFSVTLLSKFISPYLTQAALNNLSLVGSVLIFCVGYNLMKDDGKKIRVANLLPAIIIAIIIAYLPFNL